MESNVLPAQLLKSIIIKPSIASSVQEVVKLIPTQEHVNAQQILSGREAPALSVTILNISI